MNFSAIKNDEIRDAEVTRQQVGFVAAPGGRSLSNPPHFMAPPARVSITLMNDRSERGRDKLLARANM